MFLIIQFTPKPIPIIQESTSTQTAYCLAQPFAQTEGSRSGETCSLRRAPLRLSEGSRKHPGNITGSRLGETPLAWARCSLAQKFERVAWATFRALRFGRAFVRLA